MTLYDDVTLGAYTRRDMFGTGNDTSQETPVVGNHLMPTPAEVSHLRFTFVCGNTVHCPDFTRCLFSPVEEYIIKGHMCIHTLPLCIYTPCFDTDASFFLLPKVRSIPEITGK